jgi:Rps23 Pro-64 3,4-dihydroxylase Tpa1-like proline 4-hydroxylase
MKHKIPQVIIFSTLLLFAVTLTTPAQATPSSSSEIETELLSSTNLSTQQKDEIERIIDDRLERSAIVSDRIQNTVNDNFGLLFTISGLTISALGAIPVFSAAVIFIFRRTILEGIQRTITDQVLNTETQKILEDEVSKQLNDQVEEELSNKIQQKLTELEQQAIGDISIFRNQLAQLILEVEKDKREYVERLRSLDPTIIGEAAAKAATEKFAELIKLSSALQLECIPKLDTPDLFNLFFKRSDNYDNT